MYATMGEQRLILIKLKQSENNEFHHVKRRLEVVAVFTDVNVTDFDNEHKLNSNYYCHVKSMSYVHF